MTRKVKTKEVEKHFYINYLKKAFENCDSAGNALKEKAFNAAAVSAVHSAISSADTLCVYGLGKRCASEDHKDVISLIMDSSHAKKENSEIVKLFDTIIKMKNMAEYEERLIKPGEAEKAVSIATDLLNLVILQLPKQQQ
ncbi:MAG: hypothetical protein CVV21_10310 [Candidatus Goldiibacteriota bacterium HGW-Goldbacteria-1]|jgi:hypothetical protein|nr:MAG: hypothetical protein CVV21_10310 [Candidatus Goldiibacteriota bacterium HGW-Goldbacteria-1]